MLESYIAGTRPATKYNEKSVLTPFTSGMRCRTVRDALQGLPDPRDKGVVISEKVSEKRCQSYL